MKPKFFLYISLAADILIAISKFIGFAFTRSSSMLAESIHSVIDTVSQLLLIWGFKSSQRPADARHPFGYGREVYFWSLIVSLVIFILGGCISIYEGVSRIQHATFEGNPAWNYAILGLAFLVNLVSMRSALKEFNAERKKIPFIRALIRSKDTSTIIVLLGDIGELIGLLIAFFGIFFGRLLDIPSLDGYASIIIGFLLLIISGFLIRESGSLLLGETLTNGTKRNIIFLAEKDAAIKKVKKIYSIYRSPEDALVMFSADFDNKLDLNELKQAIERISLQIQKAHPVIKQVVISPGNIDPNYKI